MKKSLPESNGELGTGMGQDVAHPTKAETRRWFMKGCQGPYERNSKPGCLFSS